MTAMAASQSGVVAGLEYRRCGAPGGFPVLVHHGLVGSTGADPSWVEEAARRDVDLICVARPGYGRSRPVDMADIAEWHDVVAPLLEALAVGHYGVWGISAGAPYAYALAARDPLRVAGVAITSGLGHIADRRVVDLYDESSRQALVMFRTAPPADVRRYWADTLRRSFDEQPPDSEWIPALRDSLAHDCAGPGREAVLQQRDWGFSLADIRCPVELWHPRDDAMVPYSTAEWTSRLLGRATLHELPGDNHVPEGASVRGALEFLAAQRTTRRR